MDKLKDILVQLSNGIEVADFALLERRVKTHKKDLTDVLANPNTVMTEQYRVILPLLIENQIQYLNEVIPECNFQSKARFILQVVCTWPQCNFLSKQLFQFGVDPFGEENIYPFHRILLVQNQELALYVIDNYDRETVTHKLKSISRVDTTPYLDYIVRRDEKLFIEREITTDNKKKMIKI